ncbi:MAG: hypothetical protein HEP70_13880 [Rhodobiaceae bacterium]|nr:hypothetical protein [Rhodobiaceae bacterium]
MTDFLKIVACALALILAPVAGAQGDAFADEVGVAFDTLDVTVVTEEYIEDIQEDASGDLEEDHDDLEDDHDPVDDE